MPKLKNIEPKVQRILEEYPASRKSDATLVKIFYNEVVDVNTLSFATICDHQEDLGLPSWESIRRCRQKVQAKRPDLVDPSTAKRRRKLIEDYEEYAKEV